MALESDDPEPKTQLHVKANLQGNLGPSAICMITPYAFRPSSLIPNKYVLVECAKKKKKRERKYKLKLWKDNTKHLPQCLKLTTHNTNCWHGYEATVTLISH